MSSPAAPADRLMSSEMDHAQAEKDARPVIRMSSVPGVSPSNVRRNNPRQEGTKKLR